MSKKGHKTRYYTKANLEKIRAEYSTFKPVEEIAEELGRSVNAIHLKASRMGVSRPYNNDDERARLVTRCYTLDFDESCVGKCPQWIQCLEEYTERIKGELEIEFKDKRLKKITVKNKTLASHIVEVIRKINENE